MEKMSTDLFIVKEVQMYDRGRHVYDRMVVGFITTYTISAYHQ